MSGDRTIHYPVLGDRYRGTRLLKEGLGVSTLLGTDLEDGSQVVLKVTAVGSVSSTAQMRLEHEAAVLSRVTSPSFAPLIRFGRHDDLLYLVTPHVPGVTLEQRLSRGPLSTRDSITVARNVLTGLQEAHDQGVLHRDVKPANVIVNEGALVKRATLIDFGLARSSRLDASIRDQPVGTARYISPEQAGLIESDVDERSDLYSAGVLLFECLAGHPPFGGETVGEVLRAHMTEQPPELRGLGVAVPRVLDEVVQRLLRKDPRDRYQSAEAVLFDLGEIADALDRGVVEPAIVVGLRDRRRTLTEPAFVARRDELSDLGDMLGRTREGHGSLVFLEADSGGGKTRLLEELAHIARQRNYWTFRGQGLDQSAPQPYQLLSGVATGLLAAANSDPRYLEDVRERIGDHATAIAAALPQIADTVGAEAEALGPETYGETRTVRALAGLLDALGGTQHPALVLLDDCQWADEATLKLLAHWQRTLPTDRRRHVTIVVAFRSDEVGRGHPLRTLEPALHLSLPPLEPEDVRALVESMAGTLPAETVDLVTDLAAGSPFMASAILRGLVESGALVHEPSGWRLDVSSDHIVQSSRQAAGFLVRRIELLPPETLRLLSVGAILGKEFDLEFAVRLADLTAQQAITALDEARRRRLVWAPRDARRCGFVHDKIRETLLDQLSDDERRALHRLAALHIEQPDRTRVFELAYHFDAAGEPQRALPYALEAGRLARSQHSLEIAEQQYRIAGRAAGQASRAERQAIAEGLGDVLMLRGRYEEAAEQFTAALALAGEGLPRAELESNLAELAFKRGDLEGSSTHAEQALRGIGKRVPRTRLGFGLAALLQILIQTLHTLFPAVFVGRRSLEGAEPDRLAMRLYSRLAHVYWFSKGPVPTLWAHLREMNLAERYPPTPELAQAYSEHAPVMSLVPWFKRGFDYVERSFTIRHDAGDVWGQGQSLNFDAVLLYAASRFDEAVEKSRKAAHLLERTGDRWELNIARIHTAFALYRKGDLEAAVEEAREVHLSGLEIGDPQASGIGLEIWAKATDGRVPRPLLGVELERKTRDVQLQAEILQAEAVRLLNRDRPAEAVEVLSDARRRVRQMRLMQEYVAPVWPWLATALRREAEALPAWNPKHRRKLIRSARRIARASHRIARRYRNNLPHALRERALIASMTGRPRRARRFFDRSLNVAEQQGASYEYAQTLYGRGEVGLVHAWAGAADDRTNALQKLKSILPGHELETPAEHAGEPDTATLSLVDRFTTLLDTGRRIASALSREAIYETVREAALQLLRGEKCVILKVVQTAEGEDVTTASGELDVAFSRSLALEAVRTGQPTIYSRGRTADSSESLELSSVRSAMCVPVFVRGRAAACFYVLHEKIGDLFGEDDERLGAFIATLAGAALENAEGFAEVEALSRSLELRVQERTAQLERSNQALDASLQRLREAYEREREAVRKLRELDELKSDFLSTVSHELRTPLTSIEGFAQTLMDRWGALDDDVRGDFVGRIAANAAELNTMIGELLDFSRLERGGLLVESRPCDLKVGIQKTLDKLRPVLAGHRVEVDVPDGTIALAEPNALSRALENLLTNAAKFSSPGSRIDLRAHTSESEVMVSVIDEGEGIPSEELERIFERFYRVERGDHARAGGTGIGLAIVREFMEAQGGRVWVESELGKGTAFHLAFRRPSASPPATAPDSTLGTAQT